MLNRLYSPHTLEHIVTTKQAKWMGVADTDAPEYDREKQGCFWRDGKWVIEEAKKEEDEIPTV